MFASEKIELGIYGFVTAVGRSCSVTIGELSAALNPNAEFEILVERLVDLNNQNRIDLCKLGGGGADDGYQSTMFMAHSYARKRIECFGL
jgi:hypothetical protein